MELHSSSPCQRLFGQKAGEMFTSIDPKVVNDSLLKVDTICMDLMEKGRFDIFDPSSNNHQCHLNALRVAVLGKDFKAEVLTDNDRAFLSLSFLMSFFFIADRKPMVHLIKKYFSLSKAEERFLKDPDAKLLRLVRDRNDKLFQENIQKMTCDSDEELHRLSKEDLQTSHQTEKRTRFTYPKLAGVVLLFEMIDKYDIPCVVKIKVMSEEGIHGHLTYIIPPGEDKLIPFSSFKRKVSGPVLVFEGITSKAYGIAHFYSEFKRCPKNFYRAPSRSQRHKTEDTCAFCRKAEGLDTTDIESRLYKMSHSARKMILAIGADFLQANQKDFAKRYFTEGKDYPKLTKIYQQALRDSKELGLSFIKPETFSIYHVHCEKGVTAHLRMDYAPARLMEDLI